MKFFIIALFLLSSIVIAADDDQFELLGGRGDVIEGRSSSDSDMNGVVNDGSEGADKAVADKCNTHRMLPLKMLYWLIDGEKGLKVGWKDKKKKDEVHIEIPQYMKHCMKLQIEVKTIENNIYISARNLSTDEVIDKKTGKKVSMKYNGNDEIDFHDRYMKCLKASGDGSKKNPKALTSSNKFNRSWKNYSKTKPLTLDHKVELDKTKKMKVFFISPPILVRGYNSYSGKGVVSGPEGTCGMAEQIKKGDELVLHSGYDVMINKAFVACDTGDHETIKEMMEDKSVKILGKHVMDILDFQYDKALKADVDVQVKNLQRISKEIMKEDDEDMINSLSDELMGLISNVSSKVLNPIIEKILHLQQQIRGTSGKERGKVQNELKQWGRVLERFTKAIPSDEKNHKSGVVDKIAKYDDYNAVEVQLFQDTINVYSKMAITKKGASSDDPVKHKRKITEQILDRNEKYENKYYTVARNQYLAYHGYVSFYNQYKEEAEKGRKSYYRRYEEYQKLSVEAYRDQQKYCYGSSGSRTSQYKCILARKKLESYDRKLRQLKGRVEDKLDLADEFKRLEIAGITARGEAQEKISGGSWTNYSLMSGYEDADYANLGFRSSGINDYLLSNDMGGNNSSAVNQNQMMQQMMMLQQQQQFQGGAAQQQQFRMPGSNSGTTLRY